MENYPYNLSFHTYSPEETLEAGEKIAAFLMKGSILVINGCLGAGKTCLVKGIARFFCVADEVTSPTYTIVSEYEAFFGLQKQEKIPFFHIDAYRLGGEDDFEALGGLEYLWGDGITVIEWGERIKNCLPPAAIYAEIKVIDADTRLITTRCFPDGNQI